MSETVYPNPFARPTGSRVMVRIVKTPPADRGEVLAVYVDSRTLTDPDEVVYSVTRDAFRVEHHQRLMWRTRPATSNQAADAQDRLADIGEKVTVLKHGLRYSAKQRADEAPADAEKDRDDDR